MKRFLPFCAALGFIMVIVGLLGMTGAPASFGVFIPIGLIGIWGTKSAADRYRETDHG